MRIQLKCGIITYCSHAKIIITLDKKNSSHAMTAGLSWHVQTCSPVRALALHYHNNQSLSFQPMAARLSAVVTLAQSLLTVSYRSINIQPNNVESVSMPWCLQATIQYIPRNMHTVFVLLCCALLWLYIDWFPHIHQAHFTGTVAI